MLNGSKNRNDFDKKRACKALCMFVHSHPYQRDVDNLLL